MRARLPVLATWLALALSLAPACRSEFQGKQADGSDGETGESCPEGSAGCPCYGNASCDGALACQNGLCLDPECVAGTLDCPCHPGSSCLEGLTCNPNGICKDTGPAESETGTTVDDTGTSTTTPEGTDSMSTSTTDPTESTSSSSETSTSSSSSETSSSSSSDEGLDETGGKLPVLDLG